MRISDWSSDVCSSDLVGDVERQLLAGNAFFLADGDARTGGFRGELPGVAAQVLQQVADQRRVADRMQVGFDLDFDLPLRLGPLQLGDHVARSGRAPCRERGCPYGLIPVVAGSLKTNKQQINQRK